MRVRGSIRGSCARDAALITEESRLRGEPSIFDVSEISKYIVGMDSLVTA
ncbi:MAG: hypothetical protein FWH07_07110 [Oscillospiraceae bacterium]|nr:hypothetical protein [Oscillospiraceae bacterium]